MEIKIDRRSFVLMFSGVIGSFILIFEDPLNAQDILPSRAIDVQGLLLPALRDEWKLADKVEEAKQLLENSPKLQFEESQQVDRKGKVIKKKGQTVWEMTRKEIALAILDTETGQVFEKRYWLNIAEINKASDLRKKYQNNPEKFPRFQSSDINNEEFMAVSNWWNSFNSDISVTKEGETVNQYAVIANKYLMS